MLVELNKIANGLTGNSQALNTVICSVAPGKGRWTIRGTCRHTLVDGVKLAKGPIGALVDICTIPQAATSVATLPLITVDFNNATDVIALRLGTATGASDTASGLLSIQLEQPL